jgi:peptide/nickel transport system permease protein
MLRYVVRRMLWVVLVLFMISIITFLIFYVMPPQDPALTFAGKAPTPTQVELARHRFGLDKPIYQQYGLFVGRFIAGDENGWPGLGYSFATSQSVRSQMFSRAWITVQLALGAAVTWLLIGIPIGVISALKRRSFADRAAMGFALFGVSAPVFWLGLLALWLFWRKLGISPGTGYVPFSESPAGWFSHFWLPWLILALLYSAFYARMVRGNMIEVMGEDYIRTARAKGLPERTVIVRHGLRAALTPIVTILGLDLGALLGGAIVTETVFNLPGLGPYTIRAVFNSDIPIVLAVTMFAAFMIVFLNLVVDILYAYLDPRVRYS